MSKEIRMRVSKSLLTAILTAVYLCLSCTYAAAAAWTPSGAYEAAASDNVGNEADDDDAVAAQDLIVESVKPSADKPGYIILRLRLPSDNTFEGKFSVALPSELELDTVNTALFEQPAEQYRLSVAKVADAWAFEVRPKALRASGLTYLDLVKIVWTKNESAPDGEYEVILRDLEFTFADNSIIRQNEIEVTVNTRNDDGVESVESPQTEVTCLNGLLSVTSPVAEQVDVYSMNGALVYNAHKATGESVHDVSRLPHGVLIVKGGSGWVRKIVLR
ncbi:MAG: hypothetical protein LBJ58_01740 [Tannerellaceae bacterium]|jgi:hypothetical protein|nr:hypothetical protein [Tannerellaceae bacterium]